MSDKSNAQCISKHKYVEITYQISDEKGEILERVDIPVKYIHGADSGIFSKVEDALEGCRVGDEISVTLTPQEGFGESDPNMTFTDDIENVPEQFRHVGAEVEMQNEHGEIRKFVVSKIENGKLTVDGNHPLAGKQITFLVKVVTVRPATGDELKYGVTQNFSTGNDIPLSAQIH